MKIIIAPDKFKGSLTGMEFCKAAEEGIKRIIQDAKVKWLPLADGGDGTIEVANFYLNGQIVNMVVNNPFFEPIKASYLYSNTSKTAFIEMAEASGLKLLRHEEFDCKNATTFGTGELILDAIDKGATTIILGIGGSATNDCGIGMAGALGFQFLDVHGNPVRLIGKSLSDIKSIDESNVDDRLKHITFKIACDVTNPLYGLNGAAHTYAPQKGASREDVIILDRGLRDFSRIIDTHFGFDSQSVQGAGAAGGMGIASNVFLNGELTPGIQLIKDLANFDQEIKGADWIITGEGKLDSQTLSGKTIQGVMASAKAKNIKVAAFCGQADLEKLTLEKFGISYLDTVQKRAVDLHDAMGNSENYLVDMAVDFAKYLK